MGNHGNRRQAIIPIRVLIADDHPVVRQGLAAIIASEPDIIVVAHASDGREAVEQYRRQRPDVALLDLRMPFMTGTEAVEAIRREFAYARVIILTTYDTDEDVYRALSAGAMAYLLKACPPEELVEAIRAVHNGQKRIPPKIAAKLADRVSGPELTTRELEVLSKLVNGRSNKEIAVELSIEHGTVRAHYNNIFRKLNVNDRTQAAMAAIRRGLVHMAHPEP
jgi:two-component system NarL family response regulator